MISPQRDLVTSAIQTLNVITDVPVFDDTVDNDTDYPQINVSTGTTSNSQRSKNEQRSSYTLYIDYFDIKNNDHGLMMDTCFSIREYLKYLRLSNYVCTSLAFSQREVTDTSTDQALWHVNITIDYYITEKAFI